MATLPSTVAASPLNSSDDSRLIFTADTDGEVLSRALNDMPTDFQTMDTLSWQVEYSLSAARSDDTYGLSIRIVNGATILAAADSGGTFTTVASNITNTTDTTSAVTAFAYVNTSANKATWDGASVELRQNYTQSKGKDVVSVRVDYTVFTGTYSTAGATATLSKTLGDVTLSSAATSDIAGTLSKTLGALTTTADASTTLSADLTKTLDALTTTADASVDVVGTASNTLAAATLSADASVDVVGTASNTLADTTLSADGTVADPPVLADLSATLGSVTLTADGVTEIAATATPTLADVTVASGVTTDIAATATPTLDTATLTADASVDVVGSATPTLGAVTLAAGASVPGNADAAVTLGDLTLAADASGAQITYFGSASNPADNGSLGGASPVAVTPPASMVAGDLVCMYGIALLENPAAVAEAGGQTWTTEAQYASGNIRTRLMWCRFNGTWSANPSVHFTNGDGRPNTTVVMHVFRPVDGTSLWGINQAHAGQPLTGTTQTITGQTTTGNRRTVTVAGWFSHDDNTWGNLSGTGWEVTGGAQYRNTADADTSATFAHKFQNSPGATGNVSKDQLTLGPDNSAGTIITFEEIPPATADAAITLGAATLTSAAAVDVVGTASITLGAMGVSADASVDVVASATPTLGALTLSADGTVTGSDINATATPTLADVTLSSGVVTDLTANATPTLGALSLSSAVAVDVVASLSVTLGDATLSSASQVTTLADLSSTLGDLTLSAAGVLPVAGALTVTLDGVGLTAEAVTPSIATLSKTLDDLGLSATVSLPSQGTLNETLGNLSLTSVSAVFRLTEHEFTRVSAPLPVFEVRDELEVFTVVSGLPLFEVK